MKNLKLLFCFLFLANSAIVFAQPNQFFPTEKASWENATIGFAGIPFPDYQVLCGDTLIENNTYSKLYSLFLDTSGVEVSRQYLGGLRTETDFVYFFENGGAEEFLLYDFSLEAGQSIMVQTLFGDQTLVVTSNELINTPDGVTRRVIHFNLESWIEGIGSTRGLISRGIPLTADFDPYMNCFKYDGQLGWSNPVTQPECEFTFTDICGTTSIDQLSKTVVSDFNVFPNPFSEKAMIEISSLNQLKSPVFKIYNVQGQLVETINQIEEERISFFQNNLDAGVYIFELSDLQTAYVLQKKIIIF